MMKNKKGFTIIELSLASAFLGILLITIALLITHIITIYQKGMTLKSINTIGGDLVDNLTRSIAASSATDLESFCDGNTACINDRGHEYLYQQRSTEVQIVNTGEKINVPSTGAFCTGKYSYVWNSGYILDDSNMTYIKPNTVPGKDESSLASERAVLTRGSGSNKNVWPSNGESLRFIRVKDTNREICNSGIASGSDYTHPGKGYTISDPNAEVTELLEKSEDNLAIYDLTIFPQTIHENTGHAYYSGTFILATIRGGVNIMASGDFCTAEKNANLNTDFAYCAMNKFNFATRATGMGE